MPKVFIDLLNRVTLKQSFAAAGMVAEHRVEYIFDGQDANCIAELIDHHSHLALAMRHFLKCVGGRRTPRQIQHGFGMAINIGFLKIELVVQTNRFGNLRAVGFCNQNVAARG